MKINSKAFLILFNFKILCTIFCPGSCARKIQKTAAEQKTAAGHSILKETNVRTRCYSGAVLLD